MNESHNLKQKRHESRDDPQDDGELNDGKARLA
jgi:hypothetical protein